jgi:protein-S-isoprenylcysteine O-methyltransferase Ste14
MGASWRVGVDPEERTALVVRGPFRLVRNPIFTTMTLTAVGFTLLVPSWLAIASLVALLASLELQVRAVEEPYLRRTHGAAYEDYCAEVGRFVPLFGRVGTRVQM